MDWPVIGAVSAVVIIGGGVTYEAVSLLRSGTAPAKPAAHLLASYGSSTDRSAYDIPGFAGNGTGTGERPLSFPLIRLIDPDRPTEANSSAQSAASPSGPLAKKTPVQPNVAKPPPSGDVKLAKLTPTETEPAPLLPRSEQWRVVPTANASYFNLGGHIDKDGVVDSLASSHLRDALKQHSKFPQLPPDIKSHILTQNISLPRIAPYRSLLGIDDAVMEREQAVRFVRVR
jgi:hypothetical protein